MASPSRIEFAHKLLRARDWQARPELDQLRAWWRARGHGGAGVFALVGIGGAGKTAIADRFLRELPGVFPPHPEVKKDLSLPPPARLFVFSFYETENSQVFLAQILDWLDGREPDETRQRPGYQEVKRRLKNERGLLLVLDGLEEKQDDGARGGRFGHIMDASLRQLLLDLGEGYLAGVSAIVTTRLPLDDLEVAEGAYYQPIDVDRIALRGCVELLRRRGVKGTDTALEAIADRCDRHALTVDLIGGYLAAFHDGEPLLDGLPSHDEIARVAADDPDRKRQAVVRQRARLSRVAQRYRDRLTEHDPGALALMERICLFRTGVTAETLATIFLGDGKERVAGEALSRLSLSELKTKLHRLSEMRIIEHVDYPKHPRRVQVHPAVREDFRSGFAAGAATAGHGAVREHLASALQTADVALRYAPAPTAHDPLTQDLIEEVIHHSLEAGSIGEAYRLFTERLAGLLFFGGQVRIERIYRLFAKGCSPATARLPDPGIGNSFFLGWGLAYQVLGQPTLARVCYERYTSVPPNTGVKVLIGFALFVEGHLTHASRLFKRLSQGLKPGFASIADLIGTFLDGGRFDKRARVVLAKWKTSQDNDRFSVVMATRADLLPRLAIRGGLLEMAKIMANDFLAVADKEWKDIGGRMEKATFPLLQLAAAQVSLAENDLDDATKRVVRAEQWATAYESPEVECVAALVRAQLHLAVALAHAAAAQRAEELDLALKTVTEGIQIARRAGYGFYHLELLTLRARIQLWRGEADDAARDARTALYGLGVAPAGKSRFDAFPLDERTPPNQRGIFGEDRQALYAATHPECNYVWAEADARHLLGEALALASAAIGDRAMAQQASAELDKARVLKRKIGDPRLAETKAALARIASGAPPPFPLPPQKPKPVPPITQKTAPLVFICYARADNEAPDRWLDRLLQMIEPLNKRGIVQPWTDNSIRIGERWDAEIQRSLTTARAAVLLVSPAFLASKYIHNSELPVLLRRAQDERSLQIFSVLVRPSLFHEVTFRYPDPVDGPEEVKLADFQVGNPSALTLSELAQPDQDHVLLGIAKVLLELATTDPVPMPAG